MCIEMNNNIDPINSNILKGDAAIKIRMDYNSALNYYLDAAQHIVAKNWCLSVHQKVRSIHIADINGDGDDEILFGTEGHMLAVYSTKKSIGDKEPKKLWEFNTKDWVTGIATADINEDGNNEIIVSSDNLYILDKEGNNILKYDSEYPISAMQIFNDKVGHQVIVLGDTNGNIKCYDFNFKEIWALPFVTNGTIIDLSVGDYDGDGKIEVAAASEDKFVYIINDLGEEKDRISVRHWIINLADCEMRNHMLRLFVGKFTGDTLIYKHKQTSQAVALKQSGILDLKIEYVFDKDELPQFIVGSSDRCLSIFDYSGELIWAFETGLGQRAITIKKVKNGEIDLYVGTESGEVFSYSIKIVKDLVAKIKDAYAKSGTSDLLNLKINTNKLKILKNYVEYNPIKHDAKLVDEKTIDNPLNFIVSIMEVWFNSCSFVWEYKTKGRIYDIAQIKKNDEQIVLVGSDDGNLYCLGNSGDLKWYFASQHDLRGDVQGIRGVCATEKYIFVASADNSLYQINYDGTPEWNFCHEDWILYTTAGSFKGSKGVNVFAGTEDGFILSFNEIGVLQWKRKLKKRVRALSFCENCKGKSFVIAGCDDNNVYILDMDGNIVSCFSTPHYVLVVKAFDIDEDGQVEILTGNENGHLHVYDFNGRLIWRFKTDSWVAALDVFKNENTKEIQIVIGSQDNNMYVLNKYGALLWQYEANARVRTISADGVSNRIAFGSYDNSTYMIEQVDREFVLNIMYNLYDKYNVKKQLDQLVKSENRYFRAFAYLFVRDNDVLKNGLLDKSDIVIAAIGNNLIENMLPDNKCENIITDLLISSSRRVKTIVLCSMIKQIQKKRIKKMMAARILSDVIVRTKDMTDKIDVFRYWLSMTDSCDDILRLTDCLIPKNSDTIDEFLIDEINRACIVAIEKYNGDSGDYTIINKVKNIITLIKPKYPDTVDKIRDCFILI